MYHIEKNTVQETLVIPLYGRKACSEHFPDLFKDPEAERLCRVPGTVYLCIKMSTCSIS